MAQQTELPITRHLGQLVPFTVDKMRRANLDGLGFIFPGLLHMAVQALVFVAANRVPVDCMRDQRWLLRKIAFYRLLVIDVPFKLWWLRFSIDRCLSTQ